jgi:hypothetical protein
LWQLSRFVLENLGSEFGIEGLASQATEINLTETFADTKVIGLTFNHENTTGNEVDVAIPKAQHPEVNHVWSQVTG